MRRFSLVALILLSAPVFAGTADINTARTIAGSLQQTKVPVVSMTASATPPVSDMVANALRAPGNPEDITLLCLSASPEACGARPAAPGSASVAGCEGGFADNPADALDGGQTSLCAIAKNTVVHGPHVAWCSLEHVGLDACMARYASVIVRQDPAHPKATAAYRLVLRDAAGNAAPEVVFLAPGASRDGGFAGSNARYHVSLSDAGVVSYRVSVDTTGFAIEGTQSVTEGEKGTVDFGNQGATFTVAHIRS